MCIDYYFSSTCITIKYKAMISLMDREKEHELIYVALDQQSFQI